MAVPGRQVLLVGESESRTEPSTFGKDTGNPSKPDVNFVIPQHYVAIGGRVYMECTISLSLPPVTEIWWTKGYQRRSVFKQIKIQSRENQGKIIEQVWIYLKSVRLMKESTDVMQEMEWVKCLQRQHWRLDVSRQICICSTRDFQKIGVWVGGYTYIPFVSTTREKVEVTGGIDIVLPCSHDSNPSPTNVYWTRNGVKVPVLSSSKYNGSTIEVPALIIRGTTENDAGTYICSVSNSIGTGNSKPLQLLIREPEKQTSQAGTVVGILVAILCVIVIVVIVIWRWRKQKPGTTKRSTARVSMHRERGDSAIGLHLNSRPMSSVSADDSQLFTRPVSSVDAEYYNVSDGTSTCIRVEDLKKYIQKRQRHEELKKEYKSVPNIAEHSTTHAQTKDNMPKNRFKTTFPYDHTRVILKSDGGSDYVNANYIDVKKDMT
ncbi:unnamed protein product [Mytilus edulis]|uniref:protein-tyrosine-phosphatase n=1 Tax=Mytilus edulis TaxID=6550 RepID=A0A8S3SDD6_MYTED|nr:unnamed protein product [Mytilus edulis]